MPFKLLSLEDFPNVTMSDFDITLENTQIWLSEIDHLLTNYQDFVLVYTATRVCETDPQDQITSKQCRQLVAQWFHKQRDLLKQKCRGVILPIQNETEDLTILEVYREEIESYYKIPTEVLYHPEDLPLLAHALMNDCWEAHSTHLYKASEIS